MDFKTKGRLSWLGYLLYSIRQRGLMRTCAMGYREWRKERELGIRTFGIACPTTHGLCSAEDDGGHLYQPSSSVLFKKAMAALPFPVKEKVMLDVGSGKGRAMILAAEEGFGKVIGIEYAPGLVDLAHVNIEKVQSRFLNTTFELHDGDAVAFGIPENVDVAYLFNPFDAEMLENWLRAVLPQIGRTLHIVYMHPVFSEVFRKFPSQVNETHCSSDGEFIIYRADPAATQVSL